MALAVAGSVLRSALIIPVAYLLRDLLDHALPKHETAALVRGSLIILALTAAGALVTYVTRRLVLRLTQEALERLRLLMLRKLYSLPRTFYNSVDDSDIQSLVIQDSGRLEAVLTATVSSVLPAFGVSVAIACVALFLQPLLFALVVVTMPLTFVVTRVVLKRVRRLSKIWQSTVDDYSADVTRALRAMTLTTVVGAQHVEIERQSDTIRRLHGDALRLSGEQASARAWLSMSAALGNGLLLVVGAVEVSRGVLTLGTLLSFSAVIAVLTRQVSIVLSALPLLATAAASYERIEGLLQASDPLPYAGKRSHKVVGGLEIRSVTFGYDGDPILREVSLRIRPGEHLALLGPNGAGKTSLALLVLGLYRPDAGRLLLDGEPYEEIDLDQLHRACGVVLQDPVLLPGTIRDAISYGRSNLTDAEIARAADRVGLHRFISALEAGYYTTIGDEGARLSGGQRQRVALARALVGQPRLLVLDEPTNHLDDVAVGQLLEGLQGLSPRPTILTITHDLTVAAAADRVLHLRDGRLIEAPDLLIPVAGQRERT